MKHLFIQKTKSIVICVCMLVFAITSFAQRADRLNGLGMLLTPDNCVLLLIDHQPFQFATLGSHNSQLVLNHTIALAKTAKLFKIPTLLTSVVEEKGGLIAGGISAVFLDQVPINRTWINAWQDQRVVDWVKKAGRKKVIIAGLWTEVCVAMPAIQAAGEGYEVYVVTDASAGVSVEAHETAIQRMIMAGVMPITLNVFQAELQRDWARTATANQLAPILFEHQRSVGTSLAWELQLLHTVPTKSK